MQFALLVKSHANARYAQAMQKLAALECECMLFALNAKAEVRYESLAGTPFLIIETDSLTQEGWAYLARHSAISFAALRDNEWLRPLSLDRAAYLESDLAQVLKYKGKTNADFTAMMLHCARSASAFAFTGEPLTVLDPLCGRGTTLFCALTEGDHAVGIDTDEKAVHESDVYFEHYLQFHRCKHRREERSITLRGGGAIKERRFTFANSSENYKAGRTLTLRLIRSDTAMADEITGTEKCHLIVGDLPYGVQHSPKGEHGISSLQNLLRSALPSYLRSLMPGGAIALSFNTYTLPRRTVMEEMQKAGLVPLDDPPFHDFEHWVEQAVNRDMVVAVKRAH